MSQSQYRLDADTLVLVEDLGIRVGPGPVWISQDQFERSTCLRALVKMGQVRVSSGQRCRVSQQPPQKKLPHSVSRSRPSQAPSVPKDRGETTVVQNGISPEEASTMVSTAAAQAAQAAVAAVVNQIGNMGGGSDLDTKIEQAIARALGSVKIVAPTGGTVSVASDVQGPEEPLFIPSGIVKAEKESLDVQSTASEDTGGLSDAASALKALRKKGRKES